MDTVLSRLETVTTRLEQAEARLNGSRAKAIQGTNSWTPAFGVALPGLTNARPKQQETPVTDSTLQNWDAALSSVLEAFVDIAKGLSMEVSTATNTLNRAFQAQRFVLAAIHQCQRGSKAELQQLLIDMGREMERAVTAAEDRRRLYYNHRKAVAEALNALTWICYDGPECGMVEPAQHIQDSWSSAEFWANKVLVEYRASEPAQVNWVRQLKEVVMALKSFVQTHHPGGPTWHSGGMLLSEFLATRAKSASDDSLSLPDSSNEQKSMVKTPRKPAAPPPPAPGLMLKEKPKPVKNSGGMEEILAAIQAKGDSVTSGLRKVTPAMKSKNQPDRHGPDQSAVPAQKFRFPSGQKPSGLAKLECEQGRKWIVENYAGNNSIVIDETTTKQTVYISQCQGSTIQVKGKVNAIVIDSCQKTGLVFDDLVASCEIVNSSGVHIQVLGVLPTVAVDKCDGVQIYLSDSSLDASITTAKSSAVNVLVPAKPGEDMLEHYIPEQFVSKLHNGKFITEPVSHGGG